MGMLMFGNLLRECGVTERLSKTSQNELINIVTIMLGLAVGSKLAAEKFCNLKPSLFYAWAWRLSAWVRASGVLLAKFMNIFSKIKINPLIGSAGVSAVPMVTLAFPIKWGRNITKTITCLCTQWGLMAGVIGSAVVAGILLSMLR